MNTMRLQMIISGLGGQGILFATRLMAEAAIQKGLHVLTSETHGMAQRGGTVVSHLKVGDYSSPLIRPGHADGLIAFKEETYQHYEQFLKPDGWTVINSAGMISNPTAYCLDADAIAKKTGFAKSVNLILLGYALAISDHCGIGLWCSLDDIITAVKSISPEKYWKASITALETGYNTSNPL